MIAILATVGMGIAGDAAVATDECTGVGTVINTGLLRCTKMMEPVKRELITQAAEEAGLQCVESCCGVKHKFCNSDVWKGNLEGFASALHAAILNDRYHTTEVEPEPTPKRQVMPKVDGKSFRCACGCNVFTDTSVLHYTCNSCGAKFVGEETTESIQ